MSRARCFNSAVPTRSPDIRSASAAFHLRKWRRGAVVARARASLGIYAGDTSRYAKHIRKDSENPTPERSIARARLYMRANSLRIIASWVCASASRVGRIIRDPLVCMYTHSCQLCFSCAFVWWLSDFFYFSRIDMMGKDSCMRRFMYIYVKCYTFYYSLLNFIE